MKRIILFISSVVGARHKKPRVVPGSIFLNTNIICNNNSNTSHPEILSADDEARLLHLLPAILNLIRILQV